MYQKGNPSDVATSLGKAGRYQLISRIAAGGMGEIFLARLGGEAGFERLVVVKMLLPELCRDGEFEAMFTDEARIAARLSHPNVCEVLELGREDDRLFLVMPYLRGVPLTDVMSCRSDSEPAEFSRRIATLMSQACDGLHHAHELTGADGESLRLVHRDVSPSNLFVTAEGVLKVVDFGIAKAQGATTKTAKDEIKGKYAYMSPEQIRADPLDRRSDIFALGAVLWEALVGRALFARSSDILTAKAIIEEPIPRADQTNPDVPPSLADVAALALARRADERYPSARALGDALRNTLSSLGGEVPAPVLAEWISTAFREPIVHSDQQYQQATRLNARAEPGGSPAEQQVEELGPNASARSRSRAMALAMSLLILSMVAIGIASRVGQDAPEPSRQAMNRQTDSVSGIALVPSVSAGVAPADAGHVDASARQREPRPSSQEREPATVPSKARRGFLSIDSSPYATIYVDGKKVGVTPLIRHEVAAGRRRVRAVLPSGESRELKVLVPAGALAPPQRLNW